MNLVDSGVICSDFVLPTEEFHFVGNSGFLKAVWYWSRVDCNMMKSKSPLQLHTDCSMVLSSYMPILFHGGAISRRIWLRASNGRLFLTHLIPGWVLS